MEDLLIWSGSLTAKAKLALVLLVAVNLIPEICFQIAALEVFERGHWRVIAFAYGALWRDLFFGWQPLYPLQPYSMFLTYSVLHTGLSHLASNLIALLLLSHPTIRAVGLSGLAILYLSATIGGAVCYLLLANSSQPVIGASAAIYGLATAWVYRNYFESSKAPNKTLKIALIFVGLIGLEVINVWWLEGQTAWQAHAGGAITGLLVSYLIGIKISSRGRAASTRSDHSPPTSDRRAHKRQ